MSAEDTFIAAFRATDRRARDRWIREQGVDLDDAQAAEAAKQRWQCMPLLDSEDLRHLSREAVRGALGAPASNETQFPASIWYGGATDTYNGHRFKGTIGQFVEHVLVARSHEIAEKRKGWVVTPTTCTDGHRVNASTTAVHALNLDCDGRAEWDRLLDVLDDLDLAYIAYQSGGWSPTSPKWHILIPLAAAFDTSSPDKIDAWKAAYNRARVVFGALAELPGEGFDPTVETPAIPIFITERRHQEDPPRRVVWQPGCALDLQRLVAALPHVPPEERAATTTARADVEALDDSELETVVAALQAPMSKILSGRRDLYLAIPGALLDRGVEPDSVRTIIEELSLRCPGDPRYTQREVDDRHKQHLHDCETTIAKWERGETFTRIGTVMEGWPTVARAIDDVLPKPEDTALLARLDARSRRAQTATTSAAPNTPAATVKRAPLSLGALVDDLRKLRNKKARKDDLQEQIRAAILGALLDGEDLVPRVDGEPINNSRGRPFDRDEAISAAMGMLAFKLGDDTPFEAVMEIARRSLTAMLQEGEKLQQLVDKAKLAFARAIGSKSKFEEKEKQRAQTWRDAVNAYRWGA